MRYRLSFELETEEDPSEVLERLQSHALAIADHLEDQTSTEEEVEGSCCVETLEEREPCP